MLPKKSGCQYKRGVIILNSLVPPNSFPHFRRVQIICVGHSRVTCSSLRNEKNVDETVVFRAITKHYSEADTVGVRGS